MNSSASARTVVSGMPAPICQRPGRDAREFDDDGGLLPEVEIEVAHHLGYDLAVVRVGFELAAKRAADVVAVHPVVARVDDVVQVVEPDARHLRHARLDPLATDDAGNATEHADGLGPHLGVVRGATPRA